MNSSRSWDLQIDPNIFKQLKNLPRKDSGRILYKIEDIANDPFVSDIKKIKGEKNVWRRRVGSYRIFYEVFVKSRVLYIFYVERRTSKTY